MENVNVKFETNITKQKQKEVKKKKLTVAIAGGDISSSRRSPRTSTIL
jgi:hypothetical protein